ncbi:MAG: DNA polymerase I, partial [Firmicutes bacterium]|nr:DNA polymerase I [Bacillota bacterium]
AAIGKQGFEADDVIGTLSKRFPVKTYIVTGDKDSLQLIDDTVTVLLTKKGISEVAVMDRDGLHAAMGLAPSQIVEYKALAGDTSDNIPGVVGVGEKTALSLLDKYGTVDIIYKNLSEITGALHNKLAAGKDNAKLSGELAKIDCVVPLDTKLSELNFCFPFGAEVKEFFNKYRMNSLARRGELFGEKKEDGGERKESVDIKISKPSEISVAETVKASKPEKKASAKITHIKCAEELVKIIEPLKSFAFYLGDNLHIAPDAVTEYVVTLNMDLLTQGMTLTSALDIIGGKLADPNITKYVFDAKAVMGVLTAQGVALCGYEDIRLMQYLVDMTVDYSTAERLLDFYGVGSDESASGLIYIKDELTGHLKNLGMDKLYRDIELPLIGVLYDMERCGFCVDTAGLIELGREYVKRLGELTKEIYELAGEDSFNINSPKQMGVILFEKLKIPYSVKKKSATGYSTAADVLEPLAVEYPIVKKLLEYRGLSKLNSTYVEGLLTAAGTTGRVCTNFRQMLTTTGRLSSTEPNLQNIPVRDEEGKVFRKLFVPSKGNVLVAADYSQIELRLLAQYSSDPRLTEAFEKGADIHTMTAAEVFGVSESEVTDIMRRGAKAVNFGIIYGISEFGLAASIGCSQKEARAYMEKYFERFSSVKDYQKKMIEECKRTGYATTLFGRKRKISEINAGNYALRAFGERAAINMPLQGTAADIIKIAMLRVSKALENKKSKLILQVHDELIIDADPAEADEVIKIIKQEMEGACKLKVPLVVDAGVGKNWLDAK